MNTRENTNDANPRILRYEDYLADLRKRSQETTHAQPGTTGRREHGGAFLPEYYTDIRTKGHHLAHAPAPEAAPRAEWKEPVDELKDHNYDGIQEYDNPTPGWWHAIFVGSVVFSVLYVCLFPLLMPSRAERHARAEAKALEVRFAELNQLPEGEVKVLKIMSQESWLERGAAIFAGKCAICHAPDGAGLIGPNLTDENYANVTELLDISGMVINGSPSGDMPSQRTQLRDNEIALVTAYVASLRGKNLPTPASVQAKYEGHPIAPWPTLNDAGEVVPAPRPAESVGMLD